MSETMNAGWYTDPTGRYPHRYHDGAAWTDQVARAGEVTSDPLTPANASSVLEEAGTLSPGGATTSAGDASPTTPDAASSSTATTQAPMPGSASLVSLPDTPESIERRKKFGWLLLGLLGVLVISLVLPWVSSKAGTSSGSPSILGRDLSSDYGGFFGASSSSITSSHHETLAGYQSMGGQFAGFAAVLLGLYAVQSFARPRVRYHVAALVILCMLVAGGLMTIVSPPKEDANKLGVGTNTYEVFGGRIETSASDGSAAGQVQGEPGVFLALLASGAIAWPLAALWRDDRQRRRDAGILL